MLCLTFIFRIKIFPVLHSNVISFYMIRIYFHIKISPYLVISDDKCLFLGDFLAMLCC